MNKQYQCKRCTSVFVDKVSDKFLKTVLKKCPFCGSPDIILSSVVDKKNNKK